MRASFPTPTASSGRFHDEFEKLMWLTLMSPWGEEATEDAAIAAPGHEGPGPARQAGRGKSPDGEIRQAARSR